MPKELTIRNNRLLAAMPEDVMHHLRPHLEQVHMELGAVVYESERPQTHLYFPLDCIVSLLYVMLDGDTAEIAIVGNDGVVGVALFMGSMSTPSRAVVQSGGHEHAHRGRRAGA